VNPPAFGEKQATKRWGGEVTYRNESEPAAASKIVPVGYE